MDATILDRKEVQRMTEIKMGQLVESFFKKYKRMPEHDEIVFFCKNCGWWDDSRTDLLVKPVERHRDFGIVRDVDICCPKCGTHVKAAETTMFTRHMTPAIASAKNRRTFTGISLS